MLSKHPIKILISGAGIAGLVLARLLKKLGIPFKIIEQRSQFTSDGAGIALPANAVKALRHIELGKEIDQHTHQVKKIIYTDSAGTVLSEKSLLEKPLDSDKFVALHRHKFHDILDQEMANLVDFNTSITQMTQTANGVRVKFNQPDSKEEEFSMVVGADGVNSTVRQLMFNAPPLVDLGVTIWRWTCNYSTAELQPTYAWGAKDLFMAYPIGPNEVYCYAHVYDPESQLIKSSDPKAILTKHFNQHGGIVKTMLSILPDNQFIIPGRLRSVPKPLFVSGRVVLIGDAGHACSPMLQQGASGALEDAIALTEFLKHFSIEEALKHFEKFRSERINWVTEFSDGPMKMLINLDAKQMTAIQQKIRENGPLNVQGWKKLLASDYVEEVTAYIAQHKPAILRSKL